MPRFPTPSSHLAGIAASVYSSLAHRLEAFAGESYPFHVGDTWMEPPAGCRMEDLTVADHPGMHRYTSVHGLPALLDAIVERERGRTGLALERDNVLIAAGATGGLGAVAGALLEPGDEVLILAPYWPLIEGIVRSFHGRPVAVPVLDLLGAPDSPGPAAAAVDAIERRITPRTAALYISTPNNPSGRLVPPAWIEAFAELARRHDLWFISDEVYDGFVYSGEHRRALPLAPERTFLSQTFSKAFGMAGNRCGYIVGPRAVMAELRKVSTHTFYSTPTASQLAALAALRGPGDAWTAAARAQYAETGRRAAARLGLPAPEGSTFLFFDVAAHLDSGGLPGLLDRAVERGVLVAPGPSFGPFPTFVRLCYTAVDPERTMRGVETFAGVLER
jgi:aspartate/methionine/tyrosine aminotransferase